MTATNTTCPYCGVGCGVTVQTADRGAVELRGDAAHPANRGILCSKGTALAETLGLSSRLLYPMVSGARATWDEALDLVALRFSQTIKKYGADSVAFYVSGQFLTEDYYVANKLMKGFIGSGNIDTNSRLCMSSAVAGHKRAFGADAVPGCYEDFELADLVVLVGSNAAWCHPILYNRLVAARARRGTRIVVIDPRRTPNCDDADLHLPIKPGTDVRLFNALLATLEKKDALDHGFIAHHTEGFAAALAEAHALENSPSAVARDCGLDADAVATFFDWFAATPKTVTAFSQGVNQSSRGVDKVNAILNCHLATGRIGKPGAAPFSITGQPNAMGGREVGGLANQLAAHMDFADEANRERVGRFWKSKCVARGPGAMAVDMFRAVKSKRIRAIWIMATNPAVSLPDANEVRAALRDCEFVVVSDCTRDTDTARFAHVMLPAAAWGEKNGTVTNSERCISRQRGFLPFPGEAKPDWWIVSQVAKRMGFERHFAYASPAAIFREHAALSGFENDGARAFDIGALSSLSDTDYDALTPIQWPVTARAPQGTPRLFGDRNFFTKSGRAQFVAVAQKAPAHLIYKDYPLVLNTGRIRDQWHTMTRTGLSPLLSRHRSEPFVAVHPADMATYGLEQDGLARVTTQWGNAVYRVLPSADQKPGEIFVPIHWTDENSASAVAGRLVNPVTDAVSGQPEFKHTPAALAPVSIAWRGFLLTRSKALRPRCTYWASIAIKGGYLYELSGTEADDMPSLDILAGAHAAGGERLVATNTKRKDYRVARIENAALTHCFILTRSGALPSRDWLCSLLEQDFISDEDRTMLLSGRAATLQADQGALVCACFGIGRRMIESAIAQCGLTSVDDIGNVLKAGTNCGSCRSELRAILAGAQQEKAA